MFFYLIIILLNLPTSICVGSTHKNKFPLGTKTHTKQSPQKKKTSVKLKKQHKTILLTQNTGYSSEEHHSHKSHAHKNNSDEETTTEINENNTENAHDSSVKNASTQPHIHYIRVLLEKHSPDEMVRLHFKADDGFVLESPAGSNITAVIQESTLQLSIKDRSIYLKCSDDKFRRIKHQDLEICAPHNKITFNNKTYQGSLRICFDPNTCNLLIINKLDLEDYLYSVLRHEAIPSWPLEMLKIQAIVSRTYALYHMKQSRTKNTKNSNLYDIKNTFFHQVYNGTHSITHLRQAVEETRNIVLTYKGDFAETMFDICCGGISPGYMRNKDISKPYLCRTTPCTFCKNNAYYHWVESITTKDLFERLKANTKFDDRLKNFGTKIIDLQIVTKDKAGVVHKIKIAGPRKTIFVSGAEIKSILQGILKSTAFSIKKEGSKISFLGHGNSHFNGLCQWGAKDRVDHGFNYKEILSFYYPHTQLSCLK